MDLDRLGMGEKIAAVSGILLFVFMFLDWFSVSVSGGGFSSGSLGGGNAWDSLDWIPIFLVITIAVAIGHALIEASDTDLNAPLHGSTATTVLGAISVLLILYRIIDTPGGATFVGGSVDVSPACRHLPLADRRRGHRLRRVPRHAGGRRLLRRRGRPVLGRWRGWRRRPAAARQRLLLRRPRLRRPLRPRRLPRRLRRLRRPPAGRSRP